MPRYLRFVPVSLTAAIILLSTLGANHLPTQQATLIVTSINDNGPGTLRDAIAAANDGDTIQFDPALNGQTILLTTGELVIDKNIIIFGPAPNLLTISELYIPKFLYRIFHVRPGHTVTIAGLTISDGYAIGSVGGGILNDHSTLTLNGCTISRNHTDRQGGGIYNDGSGSSATLTIVDSTISGNFASSTQAIVAGGGIANDGSNGGNATLTIAGSLVTNNEAELSPPQGTTFQGDGGGIYNNGTGAMLRISKSTVNNNRAGINQPPAPWPSAGHGGGVWTSGVATITNSTINSNQSAEGGGISNNGTTLTLIDSLITGNVAESDSVHSGVLFSTGNGGGISNNGSGATLAMTTSMVSNNRAGAVNGPGVLPLAHGGGILSSGVATIGTSRITNNQAGFGGGVSNSGTTLTITDSSIDNNTTGVIGSSLGGSGGGIEGAATINSSTLSDNSAPQYGGALYGSGTITNSTISGNLAFIGGGIWGSATIKNSTISGNQADSGGGILVTGSLEIGNTILQTGSAAATITINGGTVTSFGHNVSNDNGGGFLTGPGDLINTDPLLGPLQNNGGPTLTHELLLGSPAINTGDPNFTSPPDFDQRGPGYLRVVNGRIDIGSFEFQSASTPTTTATATATPTATVPATPSPTATVCTGNVIFSENFDKRPVGTPGQCFYVSNLDPDTPPNDLFQPDPDGCNKCVYNVFVHIPTTTSVIRFRNNFHTEFSDGTYWDGGVLEVSSPNISGGDFLDITDSHVGASFVTGGYTGFLNQSACNGLVKREAWSGDSGGYIDTVINLGPHLAGQMVTLRFRFLSDDAVGAPGWRIDTIVIIDGVCPTPSPTASPTASECCHESPTPTATPSPSVAQPLNLSTRLQVGTGSDIGIAGFIIGSGTTPKRLLVRGIGPSLTPFGVPALADPTLEFRSSNGNLILANDNWRDTQEAEIIATGLPPSNNLESALIATVPPGPYTALLAGNNNTTGVGLVEVYDLTPAGSQLLNVSTRAFVGTGDNVVIAGFILGAGSDTNTLIRGIGPSLGQFGIPNPLPHATLELRDNNGNLLAANDGCGQFSNTNSHPNDHSNLPGSPCPPYCGGSSCPPGYCTSSLEACIYISLPSGLYTAILAGANGATGVGLVEIYNLQ